MTDEELREIKYYLGCGNGEIDKNTKAVIEEVFAEYKEAVNEKYITKIFDCKIADGAVILLYGGEKISEFQSKKLALHLKNCDKVILLAATIGQECDRLMLKYEQTEIARAAVCQACGAYFIECLCDRVCAELQKQSETDLTARFSPGYGDFPIEAQTELFALCECRRIGLTLTDSYLMVPTKSVTAIIGRQAPAGNSFIRLAVNDR